MKIISLITSDPSFILASTRWGRALVPFVILTTIFTLLIIIPQQWRQQAQLALYKQITIGARVITTTGLQGKVLHTSENFIILELADGRKIEIVRQAIASVHHD